MIFKDNAQKYWDKNVPVIPLHKWDSINEEGKKLGKAPCPMDWQTYNDKMPDEVTRMAWLMKYPNGNIGLPLGAQSRCVALDIDSCEPSEIALIEKLVPQSPWVRVGKKGKVMMFRYSGEKTFRIKDEHDRTIVELLSSKTQVVLPPSIHPDTQEPYVANCELLDVIDELPCLPKDIEMILRASFEDSLGIRLSHSGWTKTTDYVSIGSRDVKMTSVAGIYAHAVLRGEITLKESIGMLRAWCANQVEPVAGDEIDVEKGVRNLIKFIMYDVRGPKKKMLPKGWDADLTEEEKTQLGLKTDDNCVAWDYDKVKSYICTAMEGLEQNSSQRNQAIEYVMERISCSNMSIIEETQCLKHIADTNDNISLVALRKRLSELRSNGISGFNHTEIARAVLSDINNTIPNEDTYNVEREFASIRFWNDKFWKWGGSHWEELTKNEILKVITSEYGHLPAATRNSDHQGIVSVMKSQLSQQIKDVDVNGVNFANGFVDSNGTIHKHSKKWGCTYTLPYRYVPEKGSLDDAPRFKAFLESVWGGEPDFEQRVTSLREAIGATIFGCGPSLARAVLLFGVAKSGKSQLLEIVRSLLPTEIVSCVTPYRFDTYFDVVSLATSSMNICGELDEKKPIPGAIFKQVVDGSEMEACYKFGQNFKFRPKATHWFASNHLPKSSDTTEGFNRRWLIFTFSKVVKAEDRILDLGKLIAAEERESIASWATGCMKELLTRGDYTLPLSHIQKINEMAAENDSVFFFLTSEKNGPRRNKDCSIMLDSLYETYRKSCYAEVGAKPVGLRKFYSRLRELGIILGFSVTNTMVSGLTMEKEKGDLVVRTVG